MRHFGEEEPEQSTYALRGWMLHRFQSHGFAGSTSVRQRFLEKEQARLRHDVAAFLTVHPALHPEALSSLRRWAPAALPPALRR